MIPLNIKPKTNLRKTTTILPKIDPHTNQRLDIFLSKTSKNKYYKYLMLSLILIFMADGAEMVIIAMTIESIAIEFNLGSSEKSLLASIVFIGLLIGPLISSKISDKFGRKLIIVSGTLIVVIFGNLAAIFATDYFWLVLLRFLMGIGIGIIIPSAVSLISESVPVESRSFYLNNVWVAAPLGEIYVYFLCFLFDIKESTENWRYIMGLTSLPSFLSFILLISKVNESVRFLLVKGKSAEGFKILDDLGEAENLKLCEIERKMILEEIEDINQTQIYSESYRSLLADEFKDTSIKLWLITFANAFVLYGGLYIFPQILYALKAQEKDSNNSNVYFDLIFTSVIYIPTTFIAGFISDIPAFGRKKSLAIGFVISSVICAYSTLFSHVSYLSYSIIRFGIGISFSVLGVYTSEIYPTRIRTIGNSAVSAVSRISGFISPLVLEIFFNNFGYNSPIFLFLVFSVAAALLSYSLLVDTFSKSLDFSLKKSYVVELL